MKYNLNVFFNESNLSSVGNLCDEMGKLGFDLKIYDFNENVNFNNHCDKFAKLALFSADPMKPSEVILSWYSAAALAKLTNGIFEDPQDEQMASGQEAITCADKLTREYVTFLEDRDWM